uniref:Uncharacterized protein n=1 Tax=Solanum lycopersicum TaxID=4081 RepID=A0A3Q7EBA6_SOLLC
MSFQKQEKIEVVVMEEGNSHVRRLEDLHIDILVKNIPVLQPFPVNLLIPQVCPAWQSARSYQRLWKMLELFVML